MLRLFFATTLLLSSPALAQHMGSEGHAGHQGMSHEMPAHMASKVPIEPGQAAFAAIQEIVQLLEADPQTDWSKVNIEALRQHLIDMNNVTLYATAKASPIESGVRFDVTGTGEIRGSIQRMVAAHAATMNGVGGWKLTSSNTEDGATLTVITPPADLAKVRALGFIGVMTHGMHHQEHHIMIARGQHPHE